MLRLILVGARVYLTPMIQKGRFYFTQILMPGVKVGKLKQSSSLTHDLRLILRLWTIQIYGETSTNLFHLKQT
jgi:hypothetical protein